MLSDLFSVGFLLSSKYKEITKICTNLCVQFNFRTVKVSQLFLP